MKAKRVEYNDGALLGYLIQCPGCGRSHVLTVGGDPRNKGNWTFNGDLNKPSFSPSLRCRWNTWVPPVTPENPGRVEAQPVQQTQQPHICHSFIGSNGAEPGQIKFLDDCTHHLRNQTVDLPDLKCW